jgi:hypothetical protein
MEFEGRVRKILPLRSGTSKSTGNEWKALPFIFEYFENETDRYADSVLLETFDTNVIDNLQEGMEVRCGFSHRTREYEGRTYNEVRLYKIQSIKKSQEPAAPQAPATYDNTPPPPQQVEKKNDLPF